MSAYAWLITHDFIDDDHAAIGIIGPHDATDGMQERLHKGEGMPFRMRDDDRHHYYSGRIVSREENYSDITGFEPLNDYGTFDGCTIIQYINPEGEWEDI